MPTLSPTLLQPTPLCWNGQPQVRFGGHLGCAQPILISLHPGHWKGPQDHRVSTDAGILKTVVSCSAHVSLPWCERISMCAGGQTSCCSAVNHSGCLKCSLRRSLIQSLSAGSTFSLIPGLDKLGVDGCLWGRHESRRRGAERRQHLTENSDALLCSGRNPGVFPVSPQCCCC